MARWLWEPSQQQQQMPAILFTYRYLYSAGTVLVKPEFRKLATRAARASLLS